MLEIADRTVFSMPVEQIIASCLHLRKVLSEGDHSHCHVHLGRVLEVCVISLAELSTLAACLLAEVPILVMHPC